MRKLALSISLLCFNTALFAQNWSLFSDGTEYNYSFESLSRTIHNSHEVTSSIQLTDRKIYYFNKHQNEISPLCYDTLNTDSELINQVMYPLTYSYDVDSVYEFDTITLIHSISPIANNVKQHCNTGDSWIGLDSTQYQCTNVFLGEVLGISDSLKTIEVEFLNGYTDELIISKNFGVIQMSNYLLTSTPTLIGIKNDTFSKGISIPEFSEYFKLNVGDKLFWRYSPSIPVQPPGNQYTYRTELITSVNRTSTLVEYFVDNYTLSPRYVFRKELLGKILDSSPNWFGIDSSFTDNFVYFTNNRLIEFDGNDTILSFGYGVYGDQLGADCLLTNGTADYGYSNTYNTKFGLFKVSFIGGTNDLIGAIIDGIAYGDTTLYTSIGSIEKTEVKVFPNPTKDFISLSLDIKELGSIDLYNAHGKLLNSYSNTNTIDLSEYNQGTYLLKVTTNRNTTVWEKVMRY